jgi:hypothetical protein
VTISKSNSWLELKAKDGTVITVGMTVAHAFKSTYGKVDTPDESDISDDTFAFEFEGPTPDCLFGNDSATDQPPIFCEQLDIPSYSM